MKRDYRSLLSFLTVIGPVMIHSQRLSTAIGDHGTQK
jgi:hypothetical protein